MRRVILAILTLALVVPAYAENAVELLPMKVEGVPANGEGVWLRVKSLDIDTSPKLLIHGRNFTQAASSDLISAVSTSANDALRLQIVGVGKDSVRTKVTARINGTTSVNADTLLFFEYAYIDSGQTVRPQGKIWIRNSTITIASIAPGELWTGAAHKFICRGEAPGALTSFTVGVTQTNAVIQAHLVWYPNWAAATATTLAGMQAIASGVPFADLTVPAAVGEKTRGFEDHPVSLTWPNHQYGYLAAVASSASNNHTATTTLGIIQKSGKH